MVTTKIKEITKEQYLRATKENDASGIFTVSEVCGYGVYGEHYYEDKGHYFVKYQLGTSCD